MIAVGILTSYHIYCIATNTTTIEGWEKGRSLTIKGMGKIQNVMYITIHTTAALLICQKFEID